MCWGRKYINPPWLREARPRLKYEEYRGLSVG